jgi:hypothetical protein
MGAVYSIGDIEAIFVWTCNDTNSIEIVSLSTTILLNSYLVQYYDSWGILNDSIEI